ncbi:MAG: alpha/beta hydrolase [Halanaeroarchaeum sp.]
MRADEPDPQVQAVLRQLESLGVPDLSTLAVDDARDLFETMAATASYDAAVEAEDRIIDGPGGDLPIRLYRPDGGAGRTTVFFHGGGFVLGNLDTHDALTRALADRLETDVVAVDYRRAPEHPFPAAVHDAAAAVEWAAGRADLAGEHLLVAGDSAGGTLSAVVSLLARDRHGPAIDYQALFYPAASPRDDWPSMTDEETGLFLSTDEVAWFGEQYVADPLDAANPYAFPLNACEFADLPPASVVTGGFDPLHDEGAAYATALREAGLPVAHHDYPAMIHGFVSMVDRVDVALEAIDAVAENLHETLS